MIERTIPDDFVDLADVQDRYEEELLAKPNVVGVALGNKITGGEDTGEKAIAVLVETKETGPRLMAATFSIMANGLKLNSARNSNNRVRQLRSAPKSCRKAPGRHKNTNTTAMP